MCSLQGLYCPAVQDYPHVYRIGNLIMVFIKVKQSHYRPG
jgi:hypothetical protein